ncbi:hypothetical protein HELRODRAFT_184819 [Helobdella robusta]|uniref:ER membrane protein complex subunit 4 n=1 Tax=Helobdella robusta TaxID=6412 RepID=T1FM17_HELRO|nr:hypothetical protein HELRODRAFT_184819 [Helobdella robusta]ESO12376.1 hypothetical protein HELRODRAFT_184819 [Helobdella robusta]
MNLKQCPKRHKWALDFTSKCKQDGGRQLSTITLPDPPGYSNNTASDHSPRENKPDLIEKKSWDIALGPLKQVPMNLFIMWMAGNSISIFPIMMVGMMFIRPVQALLAFQQTFKMIEGKSSALQKIVYIFGNIVSVGLAVYKCHVMGLLPLHASDWLAFVEPQKQLEWSAGGLKMY